MAPACVVLRRDEIEMRVMCVSLFGMTGILPCLWFITAGIVIS